MEKSLWKVELDRGSRFTVTLPFKGIRNGEDREDQRREKGREAGKKPEQQEEGVP